MEACLMQGSEHGLATHFIPSSRVENLIGQLAALQDPTMEMIDRAIEESYELPATRRLSSPLTASIREALDHAFEPNDAEIIMERVQRLSSEVDEVGEWAQATLIALKERSPTSLKVTLELIRRGKSMTLGQALQMEYKMATAYCVSEYDNYGLSTL
jgi:3-hydroxyisobutyryl-CoA hydrolase